MRNSYYQRSMNKKICFLPKNPEIFCLKCCNQNFIDILCSETGYQKWQSKCKHFFKTFFFSKKHFLLTQREGVGTSNFTTTTGHFFHYIENGFLVDHYYVITTSKMAFQLITTTTSLLGQKKDFRHCDFTYGIKKDHNVKNQKYIFKQLPMAYYLWIPRPVGPWGVQLGSIRLGQAELGQVRFHYVKLGQIRLG